jgi:hypothetical protein
MKDVISFIGNVPLSVLLKLRQLLNIRSERLKFFFILSTLVQTEIIHYYVSTGTGTGFLLVHWHRYCIFFLFCCVALDNYRYR